MRIYKAALLGVGFAILAAGQALATPAPVCSTYMATNGTTTFPGTFVGTVGNAAGQVCQIGNQNTGPALVSPDVNPSIYSFYYGGGDLTITELVGNNGRLTDGFDVELFALASATSTSPETPALASIFIPHPDAGGPSGPFTLANNMFLTAGYYAVDNYIGGISVDPDYQLNFLSAAASAVPEPASLAVLGGALAGLVMIRRRKKTAA